MNAYGRALESDSLFECPMATKMTCVKEEEKVPAVERGSSGTKYSNSSMAQQKGGKRVYLI